MLLHAELADTINQQFLPSLLTDSKYTNVTGGQVVMGMLNGKTVEVMSGLKEISKVTTADVAFSGGVIHMYVPSRLLPFHSNYIGI